MKIDLKNLISARLDRIPFEGTVDLRAEWLNGWQPFQEDVRYQGEITSHLDVLRLTGVIETMLHVPCARCLRPLQIPLSAQVDVLLAPDGEEEDGVFPISGDAVDPEEVFVPELLLSVGMVYLCKEDCKGLCPHCGADRNVTRCDCDAQQVDERLAVLASLLHNQQDD